MLLYFICTNDIFHVLNVNINNKKKMNITHEIINIICMKCTSNNCKKMMMSYPFIYYLILSLTPIEYRAYRL